jgi:uncharacterized protein (TIGR03083 family)
MSAETFTDVSMVPPVRHREAMAIAEVENARFLRLLAGLAPADWQRPTDCERWDVRAVVVHVIASAEAQASPREFGRQVRLGRPLTAQIGGVHWVDGLNEAQLRDRLEWQPAELADRWAATSARALRARRRMPALVRALPLLPLGPPVGWKPLGFLFDLGFTCDTWMHRIDLARATGAPLELTGAHDGRIVASIAAQWTALHKEPFTLHLSGPAGGTYTHGTGGETVDIDAIEFCRILSGRGTGTGILRHPFPL